MHVRFRFELLFYVHLSFSRILCCGLLSLFLAVLVRGTGARETAKAFKMFFPLPACLVV